MRDDSKEDSTPRRDGLGRIFSAEAVAVGIALLAIVISGLSYCESRGVGEFQRRISYEVAAELVRSLPVEVIADSSLFPALVMYPDLPSSSRLGVVSLWVEVVITNTGARTFSVEDASAYIMHRSVADGELVKGGAENTFLGALRNPGAPQQFPFAVEPGHQHRFLLRVGWPTPDVVSKALAEDLKGRAPSLLEDYRLSWAPRGISLANRKPETPVSGVLTIAPNFDVAIGATVKVAGERAGIIRNVLVY